MELLDGFPTQIKSEWMEREERINE